MLTLWPTCTRLSILVPSPMIVSRMAPRSIGCPGPDFDVVLNNHAADLRHLEMSVAAHHKAEPVLPDIASRMDNDPIANQSVADHRIGADRTIAADPHARADHRICSNDRSAADFNLRTDHRTRLDA